MNFAVVLHNLQLIRLRRYRWFRWGFAIVFCAIGLKLAASVLLLTAQSRAINQALVMFGVGILLTFVSYGAFIVASVSNARTARRALARRFRMCWACEYPLQSDTGNGVCPECGRPWTIRGLHARWGMSLDRSRRRDARARFLQRFGLYSREA